MSIETIPGGTVCSGCGEAQPIYKEFESPQLRVAGKLAGKPDMSLPWLKHRLCLDCYCQGLTPAAAREERLKYENCEVLPAETVCDSCGEPAQANHPEPVRRVPYYGEWRNICWNCHVGQLPISQQNHERHRVRVKKGVRYIPAGADQNEIRELLRRGYEFYPEPFSGRGNSNNLNDPSIVGNKHVSFWTGRKSEAAPEGHTIQEDMAGQT